MKTHSVSFPIRNALAMSAIFAFAGNASAVVIFTDPFTDGNVGGGATDNSGISWFDRSSNSTISIASDATLGTGNALRMVLNSDAQNNRGIIGVLGSPISLSIGQSVSLSLSFRMAATAIDGGGGTFTTAPRAGSSGFTLGFYNSNSSAVTADNSSASDNDFGLRANFPTSMAATNVTITKEQNNSAGGVGTGTDGLDVGLTSTSAVNITDFSAHTAGITLSLRASDALDITVFFDGSEVAAGTSSVPYTTFDELVISQGSYSSFIVDNVEVDFVPEPSSVMLCALSGLAVFRRRRSS